MSDPLRLANASAKAIAALAEEPLSLHEMEAVLVAAAFTVRKAAEADQKASIFARVLASFGPKKG